MPTASAGQAQHSSLSALIFVSRCHPLPPSSPPQSPSLGSSSCSTPLCLWAAASWAQPQRCSSSGATRSDGLAAAPESSLPLSARLDAWPPTHQINVRLLVGDCPASQPTLVLSNCLWRSRSPGRAIRPPAFSLLDKNLMLVGSRPGLPFIIGWQGKWRGCRCRSRCQGSCPLFITLYPSSTPGNVRCYLAPPKPTLNPIIPLPNCPLVASFSA